MNRKLSSAAVAVLVGGAMLTAATPADAATLRSKAFEVAKNQKGDPYKYGATGPHSFDCSGLIKYSYGKAGRTLARTAQAQYNGRRKVAARDRQVGDLVFIGTSSGNIYHVGIFAGVKKGYSLIWDAPRPGRTVGAHRLVNYTEGSPRAFYGRY